MNKFATAYIFFGTVLSTSINPTSNREVPDTQAQSDTLIVRRCLTPNASIISRDYVKTFRYFPYLSEKAKSLRARSVDDGIVHKLILGQQFTQRFPVKTFSRLHSDTSSAQDDFWQKFQPVSYAFSTPVQRATVEEWKHQISIQRQIDALRLDLLNTICQLYSAVNIYTRCGYATLEPIDFCIDICTNTDIARVDLYDFLIFMGGRLRREMFSMRQYLAGQYVTGEPELIWVSDKFIELFDVFCHQVSAFVKFISNLAFTDPPDLAFPILDEDDPRLVETLQRVGDVLKVSLFRLCAVSAVKFLCIKTGEYSQLVTTPSFGYCSAINPAENLMLAIQRIVFNNAMPPDLIALHWSVEPLAAQQYELDFQNACILFQKAFDLFQFRVVFDSLNEMIHQQTPLSEKNACINVFVPIWRLINALGYLMDCQYHTFGRGAVRIGYQMIDIGLPDEQNH
ncbi:MAG: hypothetical protein LBJ89_04270 [Holosporales bacterium]|jgi:hypothetical protein|nr:hypothetical protein [Holosporales bacterium]